MTTPLPVVFQYQRALDDFRREGREPPLLKRMSELISLLDLTTTLNTGVPGDQILDAALLIVMGEMQASRGCLYVRREGGTFVLHASRGMPEGAPADLPKGFAPDQSVVLRTSGLHGDVFGALSTEVLCPVVKAGRVIAVLGVGCRADGRPYGEEEDSGFLRSVAACASTPIENGLMYEELRRVNKRLSVKVFQLNNLFDIARELTSSFDEEAIKNLVTTTLMGHLMVSRCALYLAGVEGLSLAHQKGFRRGEGPAVVPPGEAQPVLDALQGVLGVAALPDGPLKAHLTAMRLSVVVPLMTSQRAEGFLAVGERGSRAPFTEEDLDFALTLARQAMAALETVRLHRVSVEKQRQDRELQIAHEIQQSLFPRECPRVRGFEVAAESRPCYQVGGDYYDFITLPGDRLALVIADVSGKGTPASILMASVHASLQALAGTASPAVLMERLNHFLYASTQANKYVTLFYAELDPSSRRLEYINAGHVPPYWIATGGRAERLFTGGPVLGLLETVSFEVGELTLEPGDILAMVTDGATEALSRQEVEFGDERVIDVLRAGANGTAAQALVRLVDAVQAWVGAVGCSDDLTALVLKAS